LPITDDNGNTLTLYLRVWEERLPFTPNADAPVKLGMTGVQVTLTGTRFRAGDYWSIGVRPATPQVVYPERLLKRKEPEAEEPEGKAPDGLRYFVCPLALIRWTAGQGVHVLDCLEEAFVLDLVALTRRSRTALDVSSGRVIFEGMSGLGEISQSPPIKHGLEAKHIAIVLALEIGSEDPQENNAVRVMGDTAYLSLQESPLMWAVHTNATPDQFVIILQDRRQFHGDDPPAESSLIVRWWAIPKTLEQGDIHAPPPPEQAAPVLDDFVIVRIAMRPGIRINPLAQELEVQPEALGVVLDRLVQAGRIRRDEQGRHFLPWL
jgi:hypothetical protein